MGGVEERESLHYTKRERERLYYTRRERETESLRYTRRERERERERDPGKVTGRVGPDGVYFPVSASATACEYRPGVWQWMSTTVNLDTVFSI